MASKLKTMLPTLIVLLVLYLAVYAVAWFLGDRLIYPIPPTGYQDTPEIIKLQSGNYKISALHLTHPAAQQTILYSHGNGEDLGYTRPLLRHIHDAGFNVFAYDYRGYGTSQGQPSEAGLYQDITAAYRYLVDELQVPPEQILVQGRSLGGGPSVELATKEPVGGVILESTFVSISRVLTRIPLFPIDKFNNLGKIANITVPLLIIHGKQDQIVPFWHGQSLFTAANNPKQSFWVDEAGHNNLVIVAGDDYLEVLRQFAQTLTTALKPSSTGVN